MIFRHRFYRVINPQNSPWLKGSHHFLRNQIKCLIRITVLFVPRHIVMTFPQGFLRRDSNFLFCSNLAVGIELYTFTCLSLTSHCIFSFFQFRANQRERSGCLLCKFHYIHTIYCNRGNSIKIYTGHYPCRTGGSTVGTHCNHSPFSHFHFIGTVFITFGIDKNSPIVSLRQAGRYSIFHIIAIFRLHISNIHGSHSTNENAFHFIQIITVKTSFIAGSHNTFECYFSGTGVIR